MLPGSAERIGQSQERVERMEEVIDSTFRAFAEATSDVPNVRETATWEVIPDTDEEMTAWTAPILKEEAAVVSIASEASPTPRHVWREIRSDLLNVTGQILEEGEKQYKASFREGVLLSKGIKETVRDGAMSFKEFMVQPVWVPGRKNKPKQYSRGTLFFLDIFRFGGTFATLFITLFFVLNYQSFWSIAMAKLDPVTSITTGKELASEMDDALAQSLTNTPSLGGIDDSSLLSYLPKVGPPENRLIVPKLGLNVPIVIPPIDSLLKEDWTKLEEEIQTGLQSGVVHYPGTAQPGQAGNFFVTGHSSYFPWAPGKFKSVFARLPELEVGDEYWVFYGGDKFRYVIEGKKEINPNDVTALDQPINKRISSLMTCTPVGTTLRRMIITAQELDPVTGQPMEVGEHQTEQALPKMNLQMLPI